jgi:hypothetical protein
VVEELEPQSGEVPLMLYDFCSPNMPRLSTVSLEHSHEVVLPAGQVGNTAAFDCYHGSRVRGLPSFRSPGNELGSFGASVTLPVENVVFDLIFHRSLAISDSVEAMLYGFPLGGPDFPSMQQVKNQLPMTERPFELAGPPPALATPLVPAITRIAERVYTRMGWTPSEFRGLRLQIPYAPMGSQVVMRWPLPAKP